MKGYLLSAVIISLMLFSGCSKINDSTEMNFSVSPSPTAYKIPIITTLDTGTIIASIPVRLDLDSMIKAHNKRFSSGNIKSIKLNSIILTITDTVPDVTFSSFENLRMTIQGGSQSSNLLASLNPSESPVKTLNIPVTATVNELKGILGNEVVNYVIKGKLRKATTKVYAITASSTFRVELGL
jgi:hypothetical protein